MRIFKSFENEKTFFLGIFDRLLVIILSLFEAKDLD